jgi:hypothetical protein
VNESEVTLISADDISKDYISRDGAPSPQFFIPEPSEDNISSMSYSPKYTQANQEQTGQILEPNLLNREAREIDANLAREVMMNANLGNQTVVETIDPSLLLPSLLLPIQPSNPEPMEAEDSPLSSIGDREMSELEREFNPNPSSEVEAVPGGDVDASGDEIAPGEEYGSPREGAPYGVVTIQGVEAVSQDVDASGDEIAPGEEYGSPQEGAPWGDIYYSGFWGCRHFWGGRRSRGGGRSRGM